MQYAGRDASEPFNRLHSPAAKRLLRTLLVGELASPTGGETARHHSEEPHGALQSRDVDGGGAATTTTRSARQAAEAAAEEAAEAVAECVNVDDVQRLAAGRLTAGAAAYYSAGAEDGVSLADNLSMWGRWALRPRVLVDVSHVHTTTRVLGVEVASPYIAAPTALLAMAHPAAETAVAAACASAHTICCVSTTSSCSLEDVAAAAPSGLRCRP